MLNEAKLTEYYSAIADKLDEMIPCEWDNVYLYGEVLDDSREVYFYFKPAGENEFVYGHDVPARYDVDRSTYRQLLRELRTSVTELYNEYKDNGEQVWTNFTFSLDSTGKFNINFNYDDVLNSDFTAGERQIIWEYEVLGIEPAGEYKEMLNKYLKSRK